VCEIVWAIGLKTFGFKWSWGGAMTVAVMLLSFILLDRAMRTLPLGTAYGVWTGIGAVGTAVYGMIWLREPRDWPRVLCIVLVIGGVVGLKLLSPRGG
jgi:quaternary ammonium compound-resistance protein SugE